LGEVRSQQRQLVEQQDKIKDANAAEMDYTKALSEELRGLADESGNVAEKDKARAQFIINELNKALDTEYEMIGNQIQGYESLRAEIDKQIEQKKIQLMLEAEEVKYREAIINVTKAQTAKEEAKMELDKARDAMNEKYSKANKERLEAAEKAYMDADSTYKEYNENIRIYETATAEMLQGNNENAIELLQKRGIALKSYEDTLEMSSEEQNKILQDQFTKSVNDLDSYREKYLKGVQGFSADGLREAQIYANEAQKEYAKVGGETVNGYINGINSEKKSMWKSLGDIFRGGIDESKKTLEVKSPSKVFTGIGGDTIQGYINGANNKSGSLLGAMKGLFTSAISTAKKVLDSHSPSRVFDSLGGDTVQGYTNGVLNNADTALKAISSTFEDVVGVGKEATEDTEGLFSKDLISDSFIRNMDRLLNIFSELKIVLDDVGKSINHLLNISDIKIPRFATGTVVPHSQKIISAQKQTDINNEDKMINKVAQMVITAMDNKTDKEDKPLIIEIQIGDEKLGKTVIRSINKEQERAGKTLIKV